MAILANILLLSTRTELAGESFFPQSYGISKQRDVSESIDFYDVAYKTSWPNHDAVWQYISQYFRRYKLEIFTQFG